MQLEHFEIRSERRHMNYPVTVLKREISTGADHRYKIEMRAALGGDIDVTLLSSNAFILHRFTK